VAASSSGDRPWLRARGDTVLLRVWAVPGAGVSEVAGERDDRLRVRLAAPPRDGRANDELRRFVAAQVGVARADVDVTTGRRSRRKTVLLRGTTVARVVAGLCS
jgi:uncharacterized protein (TIGR00251 family)